jgi:AcrR family transcriptional regulator
MPRSPEQCAVIRDRRRNKILEKSLHLFALKGFDEVSVDDIMSATNCSHGLFYHYFTGKEDIYNALMKQKEERYEGYLIPRKEIIQAGGLAGITILCQYCEKLINADDDLVCFAALTANRHFAATSYNEALLGDDPFPTLVDLIKQGQAKGEVVAGDPCELAHFFFDFCNGAMKRRVVGGKDRYCIVHAETMLRVFKK